MSHPFNCKTQKSKKCSLPLYIIAAFDWLKNCEFYRPIEKNGKKPRAARNIARSESRTKIVTHLFARDWHIRYAARSERLGDEIDFLEI